MTELRVRRLAALTLGSSARRGGSTGRFLGMPSTRSTYWCNTTCGENNPGGSWYAIGDGDRTKISFTIDQSSRLPPVQIQDEGDDSATDWIIGKVLPAGSTTVTFTNMGLNPDYAYEFDIFAFTGDIAGGSAPTVFNIASSRIDFVLTKSGPQSGEPRPTHWTGCCAIAPGDGAVTSVFCTYLPLLVQEVQRQEDRELHFEQESDHVQIGGVRALSHHVLSDLPCRS